MVVSERWPLVVFGVFLIVVSGRWSLVFSVFLVVVSGRWPLVVFGVFLMVVSGSWPLVFGVFPVVVSDLWFCGVWCLPCGCLGTLASGVRCLPCECLGSLAFENRYFLVRPLAYDVRCLSQAFGVWCSMSSL